MRRILASCIFGLLLAGAVSIGAGSAQQDPFNLTEHTNFGSSITITGTLTAPSDLVKVNIFAHEQGSPNTYTRPVQVTRLQDGTYRLEHVIDLSELPLRTFATMEYRLEASMASGEMVASAPRQVVYEDNRFPWKTLAEPPFHVHWYEGSTQFAQSLLDIAQKGLLRAQTMIGFTPPGNLDIYVYPNSAALQETLTLSGRTWVAGHADPDLGLIVVSLPAGPEQQLLAEQRIPHELSHVLLYQAAGTGYAALPAWLNEGLATEAELFPNPDYQKLVDAAAESTQLIPMSYLCAPFPKDASSALLAYAQSASFTGFLLDTYGQKGVSSLLSQYAQGLDCEHGAGNALGKNLSQLEAAWQKERFGMTVTQGAWIRLIPWLVILAAVLIPILLLAVFLPRRRK